MKPYYDQDGITIYHGDCRAVLPSLDPVDHVLTDPPYSREVYVRANGHNTHKGSRTPDRMYKGASMAALAVLKIGEVDECIAPVSVELGRLIKRWGVVFSDAESLHVWRAALEGASLRYIRTGAWVKPHVMPQMSGDRPAMGFEPCTIVHAKGPMRWNGGGGSAVWTRGKSAGLERPEHPCPKPIAIMRDLVQQFTDVGELILDPFMGSGTTLRAAKDLGRRAIGIEIEERYCEIAAKRLSQGVLFGTEVA